MDILYELLEEYIEEGFDEVWCDRCENIIVVEQGYWHCFVDKEDYCLIPCIDTIYSLKDK